MAQINIKWVNAAKEGKKFGSLVDVDGTKYMCPAGIVSQFRPGTTVDVPTQQAKWGVDIVNVIAGHAQASAPSTAAWSKPQAPAVAAAATGSMDRKDALIFVVSNPVDILTQLAQSRLGLPWQQVLGLGTMLDTARFRSLIAGGVDLLLVDPDDNTIISVSITMTKAIQLGRRKVLELTIQKVRIMN